MNEIIKLNSINYFDAPVTDNSVLIKAFPRFESDKLMKEWFDGSRGQQKRSAFPPV